MPLVFTTAQRFDVERLTAEVSLARSISEFKDGPYGNCISLPAAAELDQEFRNHHNNIPFSDALHQCPCMREIVDSFLTEKAAVRLLRRVPKAAYALHDDKDKGQRVLRFQIPIITNDFAFLLLTRDTVDFTGLESLASRLADEQTSDCCFDLGKLDKILSGQFDLFTLQPGQLYYFDTDRIHTLINAGDDERVVLSLDLIVNDWLRDWMRNNLIDEVPASTVQRTSSIDWQWQSLRHGVIRND